MIIAEIGLNHMGSEPYAFSLVNKLLETKIDAITFQVPNDEYFKIDFILPLQVPRS